MVCLLQDVKGKQALPGSPVCVCTVCPRRFNEDAPEVWGPSVRGPSVGGPSVRGPSVRGPSVLVRSLLPTLQRWFHVEATSSDNSCYISLLTSWSWSFRNVH